MIDDEDLSPEEQAALDGQKAGNDGEAAEPEVKAADAPQPDGADPEPDAQKRVPLAALHESRQREKETRAQLAEMQARWQKIEERLAQRDAPKAPDPKTNPLGAIRHELQQTRAALDQMQKGTQATTEQQRERDTLAQLSGQMQRAEHQFRGTTPDYDAAIEHLRQTYDRMWATTVPDPAAREQIMGRQFVDFIAQRLQAGENPAQAAYALAKSFGYAPAAGGDKLAKVADGQKRSASLTKAGGGAPQANSTLQQVADMSDDEFDAWAAKNDVRKLFQTA